MVTKSRLKMALAAERGTDFVKLKQRRKQKDALKSKRAKDLALSGAEDQIFGKEEDVTKSEDTEDEYAKEDESETGLRHDGIDESDSSDSSFQLEPRIEEAKSTSSSKIFSTDNHRPRSDRKAPEAEEEGEDEGEAVPLSDLEDLEEDEREDLIPFTRLTINNTAALLASLSRISIPTGPSVSFAAHQTILSDTETSLSIPDVSDDLQRELAFYSQSIDAVRAAHSRLRLEGLPISRPKDYFAEMIKEDAHMEKVKAKLVEEASAKKAAAEARKLRDLKKFGKQVQVAKLQERQKAKRETLERIKSLKRKRQESNTDMATNEADIFDVGVEAELADHKSLSNSNRSFREPKKNTSRINTKRQNKNEKYGFGGRKRHSKSGDAMSSGDMSGFNARKMKYGTAANKRPGKARRMAMATK